MVSGQLAYANIMADACGMEAIQYSTWLEHPLEYSFPACVCESCENPECCKAPDTIFRVDAPPLADRLKH